ncbi:MAG: hypothetical protein AB4042_10235 [Leptolyngbyaceae cyanobacterium]
MHRDNIDRYQVQFAPSLAGQKRLGSYLVDAGLINRGQIEVALNDQKATGMKFGEVLATRGWIKQQTVEFIMEKVVLPERQRATGRSDSETRSTPPVTQPGQVNGEKRSPSPGNQITPPGRTAPQSSGTCPTQPTQASRRSAQESSSSAMNGPNGQQRRVPPISKPLSSVPSKNEGVNWVG